LYGRQNRRILTPVSDFAPSLLLAKLHLCLRQSIGEAPLHTDAFISHATRPPIRQLRVPWPFLKRSALNSVEQRSALNSVEQRMWGGNKEPPATQHCSHIEGAGFELSCIYCWQYAMLSVYYSVHAPNIKEGKGDCEITHNLETATEEKRRTWWRSWLRHCATNPKVAGSILNSVIGIFHWLIPSGRTMAVGLTQPLTEIGTRYISWG